MIINAINLTSRQVWPNEILFLPIGPPLQNGQKISLEWNRSDGQTHNCSVVFDQSVFIRAPYQQLHFLVVSADISDFSYKVAIMCEDDTCVTFHIHCDCEIVQFKVVKV